MPLLFCFQCYYKISFLLKTIENSCISDSFVAIFFTMCYAFKQNIIEWKEGEYGMKYTPMVRQAMKIAYEAHHGQVDKAGVPYIFHPIHLAEQMEEEISICVALLHDVIEDTNISEEKLREEGISSEVIYNIKLLTKSKEEEYMDYLERIKSSEIAVKVKLADLKHNSDASRLLDITEKDKKRLEKYTEAIKRLTH